MRLPTRRRGGFTMIDLLVVISIIGLLVGLLMPAVQQSREAANRAACANNLKQIALGAIQHHDTQGVFPSNGGWDGRQTIAAVNGPPVTIYTRDRIGALTYWGVGDPDRSPRDQTGSWAYALLPFVEQGSMHRDREWTAALKLYSCPSRRPPLPMPARNDDSGQYEGGGWAWGKTDYAANWRLLPNRPICLNLAEVSDGSSNTVLVGEKALNFQSYATGTWYFDEPFFSGGSAGTARNSHFLLPDSSGSFANGHWGSAHSAGANFSFADGSVRLLKYRTPTAVIDAILSPSGGDIRPEF